MIFDLQGRVVVDQRYDVTEEIMNLEVPMHSLPEGMYIARVIAGGRSYTKKFTRQ